MAVDGLTSEQVNRMTTAVQRATDGMAGLAEAFASAATAIGTFGAMYAGSVEAELDRRRKIREARRG